MIAKVTKKWTMRSGTKIRICDMGDGHLLNAIRMLERFHGNAINAAWGALGLFRGEMAQAHCENAIDQLEEEGPSYITSLYDDLCAERDRRGLK